MDKETLTYFSGKEIEVGDIVSAPVRKKEVEGLVINVENVSSQKGDIKDADFNLKKIIDVKGKSFFKDSFLATCHEVKNYCVASTGQILDTLIPNLVFENYHLLKKHTPSPAPTHTLPQEKLAFQAPTEDRLVIYKTFVREAFAKKESVFFCFPTIAEAQYFYEFLRKGIEGYVFFLHASLPKKEFIRHYNSVVTEQHPVIVFGTPAFLFLPRDDFRTFIIERESSKSYRTERKPYLDTRIFLEILSYKENAKIMFADSILRTETIWRAKQGELTEFQPLNFRLPEKEEEEIIDQREEKDKRYQIISKRVFEKMIENEATSEHMLLFTLRKGYATTTICNDCGTTLTKNGESLILFEDEKLGRRIFRGTKSKKIYEADILCGHCGSWNLAPLGIGTQKVYEEALTVLPKEKIFVLDTDSASTKKQAMQILKNFEQTPGAVLIGTEMSLLYLSKEVSSVAIISFDSLFNIPVYNIYEKIIDLVVLLNSYTKKSILLQTRHADEKILKDIENRNLVQFYKDDILHRKNFRYPPFYTLIKVSYDAMLNEKDDVTEYLKQTYEAYVPMMSETRIGPNKVRVTMILKIEREKWSNEGLCIGGKQDKELLRKLSALPPYWSIHINPERLF